MLFGMRRHWIWSILDEKDRSFLGVMLLDEIIREMPAKTKWRFGNLFLKRHEQRLPCRIGDGELGVFLCPQTRGQGIAIQAIYVLLDKLSIQPNLGGRPILCRIWAETGSNNLAAHTLLRKIGLVDQPKFTVPPGLSHRFERDGTPISLMHFDQPETDEQENSIAPVKSRLADMRRRNIARPEWIDFGTFACGPK
jgi:hypothetical protein